MPTIEIDSTTETISVEAASGIDYIRSTSIGEKLGTFSFAAGAAQASSPDPASLVLRQYNLDEAGLGIRPDCQAQRNARLPIPVPPGPVLHPGGMVAAGFRRSDQRHFRSQSGRRQLRRRHAFLDQQGVSVRGSGDRGCPSPACFAQCGSFLGANLRMAGGPFRFREGNRTDTGERTGRSPRNRCRSPSRNFHC